MKLLLDTHIAIFFVEEPGRIRSQTYDLIMELPGEVYVSAASIWEIAIKSALGKRVGTPPFGGKEAIGHFTDAGLAFLDVTPAHAAAVQNLPPLHANPFDRLLVAQALYEPMRLVTADRTVARYSETIILG